MRVSFLYAIDLCQSRRRLRRGAETLSGETKFADLKCKSVDLVKFSTALEDEFEIEVPYMQMRRCVTFADACDFVAKEIEG